MKSSILLCLVGGVKRNKAAKGLIIVDSKITINKIIQAKVSFRKSIDH